MKAGNALRMLSVIGLGFILQHSSGVSQERARRVIADDLEAAVRIDIPNHPCAAPYWGDIDGDGQSELLVGQYKASSISLAKLCIYRNMNAGGLPVFDEGSWFTVEGRTAGVPELCYTGFGPQIVDFNRDGLNDILSGAPKGQFYLFPGIGNGNYAGPKVFEYILDERTRRGFAYNARLFAYDWNHDGDMDLLVGDAGSLWLTLGSRSNMLPPFSPVRQILVGGEPITGSLLAPFMADWDGDQVDDLLVAGRDGEVTLYRNLATDGEPDFAEGTLLIGPVTSSDSLLRDSGHDSEHDGSGRDPRICVADFDGDGRPDLLVGDYFLERVERATDRVDDEAKAKQYSQEVMELRTEYLAANRELERASGDATSELRARIEELRNACERALVNQRRFSKSTTDRMGDVWLYRRR